VAVDEVKLSSVLERFGDVKVFGYFGIDGGILFISVVHHGMQMSVGHRIPAGEQRYLPATGDEPFGDDSCLSPRTVEAANALPGTPYKAQADAHSVSFSFVQYSH
jgi:hypothetical protein